MSGRFRDERGQVIVLGAVMIPVLLLLAALVIDVGNWYTHKRQLQNRADAAAFAAGVAYGQNWKACVYSGSDPDRLADKTAASNAIADAARQFAADPEASDYAGGALPSSLYNSEIATQSKVNVNINSTSYDNTDAGGASTDNSDGGNPCFLHSGDDISAAGYWTDVKVQERDLPSLFGGIGLPLSRNGARARVDIRPAISGHRFLPIAVPDNIVTKVQVRYYDGCSASSTPILTQDLAQLPDGDYDAYQDAGGGTLWAIPIPGSDPPVGDKNRSVALPMSPYDSVDCGANGYRPIVEQVRLASSDDVNLDAYSCDDLKSLSFADCFNQLSQIRIWDDGDPSADEPLLKDVHVLGGCGAPGDAYFGTLPLGESDCAVGVTADVDWGSRDDGPLGVAGNFTVRANGTPLTQVGDDGTTRTYSSNSVGNVGAGRTPINITLTWQDTTPAHEWNGNKCIDPPGSATTPCKYNLAGAAQPAHATFVGVNSIATKPGGVGSGYDENATGAVESVHTSLGPVDASGALGPSFDNWHPDALGCTKAPTGEYSCPVYPTVGVRSALTSGQIVTLRTKDSQGSQLVHCDPAVTGQVLTLFLNGCQPWFGPNDFKNSDWWIKATQQCPESGNWYKPPSSQVDPYINSANNPWRCVLQDTGKSVGQAGDWMAVATDNCTKINGPGGAEPQGTQCQDFKKKTDPDVRCADYDGIDTNGDGVDDTPGWVATGDSADPRLVSLFIVPYQAFKNVVGGGTADEMPVLRFASFYVMNWWGQNTSSDDPCPDLDLGGNAYPIPKKVHPDANGTIIGVFDTAVDYEPGPVDPTAVCREDDPTPCRAVLVR